MSTRYRITVFETVAYDFEIDAVADEIDERASEIEEKFANGEITPDGPVEGERIKIYHEVNHD